MKNLAIFSILFFFISLNFAQAQGGVFGAFEKAFDDVSETFTGDKAEAAAAKQKTDAAAALVRYNLEQDSLQGITDAAEKERIAVYALDSNGENQLMRAIRANNANASADLIKRGADARLVNVRGLTPLHEAVKAENPKLIDLMILNGGDVNAKDRTGKSPLDYAMQNPKKSVINSLVLNDAPVEIQHIDRAIQLEKNDVLDVLLNNSDKAPAALYSALTRGKTDLFTDILEDHNVEVDNSVFNYAVDKKNFEIAEVVLNKSIDMNQALTYAKSKNANQLMEPIMSAGGSADVVLGHAIDKRNHSLAETAISIYNADPNQYVGPVITKNDMKMLDLLLANGADADGGMAIAVAKNNTVVVKKLLDNSADPNAQLKNAAIAGNNGAIQAMLDEGGDPNLGALAAAEAGKYTTAKLLVENGAEANPILPLAIKAKNEALVKTCLDKDADPNLGFKEAINIDASRIVVMLLDAGADASNPEFIQKSAEMGNEIITKKLLDSGADPNNGINIAVTKNHLAIVNMLIANGADGSSTTLLKLAVKHNSTDLTKVLFEAGANASDAVKPAVEAGANNIVNQLVGMGQDVSSAELLSIAVSRKYSPTVSVLLKNGSDPNVPLITGSGYKMIHVACANTDLATAQMLIQYKAEVMIKATSTGDTPLHVLAMQKGSGKESASIAEMLIANGAEVNAKNNKGELVFQVAKGSKVKKVLKKNGASKN